MKKFLLLLSGWFVSSTIYAQQMAQKPIFCAPLDQIVQIAERRGDDPILIGDTVLGTSQGTSMNAKIIIAHNFENKTFSIYEIYNTNWACILGQGTNFLFMHDLLNKEEMSNDPFKGLNINPDDSVTL